MPKDQPPTEFVSERRVVIGVCIGLFVITWLVFGQTLTHDFVNYDDQSYVYENARVKSGLTIQGIIWAFTHVHSYNWHPLTWISHMLDYQVFGPNAGGHHFTNVLLHSIASVLLFLVLRQMTSSLWRSAFVAAIFAVHPLHVESVAWIAERKDVLSAVFFFLTLGAYVRYVRCPSRLRYLIVLLLFAAGLMSKPMLVTLPLILLLLDIWPLERLTSRTPKKHDKRQPVIWSRQLLLEKVPFFAMSAASCLITLFAQHTALAPIDQLAPDVRLANAAVSYNIYLWQMFVPFRLVQLYPFASKLPPIWQPLLCLGLLVVITGLAIQFRNKRPYLFVGWLWYLVMLLPVIGVIQVGAQAHADRYTYLSEIGIYVALIWGIAELGDTWQIPYQALAGLGTAVVISLAAIAWKQATYWKNSESIWRHAIAVTPYNHIAYTNLGDALLLENHVDQAIEQFEVAVQLEPKDFDAENGLGSALSRNGKITQAITHFRLALALRSDYPELHNNLGNALSQEGQVEEGIAEYRKAIRLRPDSVDVHNAETHFNLANALLAQNKIDEAIAEYQLSLKIQSRDADVRDNLGTAFLRHGDIRDAQSEFETALKIDPNSSTARNYLAWTLATCSDSSLRNGSKAIALAQEAQRLTEGKDPVILRTLAAAYAENGRFSQAVETARSALELANTQHNARLVSTLEKEIALYQAGSPYHERQR